MLDYELVKKHFADKLAADFSGQGRFESAFYHTIKMVYQAGLNDAGKHDAATLIMQRDELLEICRNVIERGIGASDIRAMEAAIAKVEAT